MEDAAYMHAGKNVCGVDEVTDEKEKIPCPNCTKQKTLYYAGMVCISLAVMAYVAFLWHYTDKVASVEEYEKLQSTCQAMVTFCGQQAVMPWGAGSDFDYSQFSNKTENDSGVK